MRWFRDTSLRNKLTLILLTVVTVALFLSGFANIVNEVDRIKTSIAEQSSSLADVLGGQCIFALKFDDPASAEVVLGALSLEKTVVVACIYDAKGEVFATYKPANSSQVAPPHLQPDGHFFNAEGDLEVTRPIVEGQRRKGAIYIRSSMAQVNAQVRQHVIAKLLILAVALAASFLLASFLHRFVSRPILQLASTAQKISTQGDYSLRVQKEGNDETGALYDGFNAMLDQIQKRDAELEQHRLHLEELVQERTRNLEGKTLELARSNASLASLNADHLAGAQAVMAEIAARLALPAVTTPVRPYPLAEFSLTDMMHCGAIIRGMSSRHTKSEFGEALVRHFYDQMLGPDGSRALALARLFVTRRFEALDAELCGLAAATTPEITPQTMCLTLVGTAGDQGEWNDIHLSRGHRVIPLPSAEAIERLPMIAQLLRQFGVEVGGVLQPDPEILVAGKDGCVFHVSEARGSPYIPAQDSFVIPSGIRSVIGFGGLLPDGRLFAVILFAKVPVAREVAVLFGHLALSTRMSLLAYMDFANKTTAQILSLDHLLRDHERIVEGQEQHLRVILAELARSNTELEQFAYIASHDLQEPLRKVQAFGDLLLEKAGPGLGEEERDYLKRMQVAAARMQGLVNDLLTFARVSSQAKPMVPVDLAKVAREVLSDLEARVKTSGGRVEIGQLPRLDSDPLQMRQLLQNLIGNALKFHRPNVPPVIVVESRIRNNRAGLLLKHSRSDQVCELTVRDNGIGFEEKYLDRIFHPFQRLHGRAEYEGTGMGLAICRKIVERHHGTVTARSTPGEGSTFIVLLPFDQTQREEPNAQAV